MSEQEMGKCSVCGKDGTMRLSTPGGKETPPLCPACFDKALKKARDKVLNEKAPAKKGEIKYWTAPAEVVALMSEVLDECHEDLSAVDVGIALLFRDPPKATGNRTELAQTRRVPEHLRELCGGYDFVTVISAKPWDDMRPARRCALLDHELQHIEVVKKKDGSWKLAMRRHDVGDFVDIIRRRGFWMESEPVKEMFQKVLFAESEPAESPKAKKGRKEEAAA